MTESTELALPEPMTLATMFKAGNGLDPLLNKIKADALAMVKDLDPAVKKDRDLMKSAANKVSMSKAEIDRHGKELTEAQRKEVAAVNAGRKVAETFLADLRDLVKKPADEWEGKEATRITAHKEGLAKFDDGRVDAMSEPDLIQSMIDRAKAFHAGRVWEEYASQADTLLRNCLTKWQADLDAANLRIAQAAELEALRADKSARDEADRIAREAAEVEAARIAQEAQDAENARVAAVQEAERQAKIEADKLAAADLAAQLAREDAEAKAKAAEERHAKELADAETRREQAAQAERDRVAAEKKAADDARAKREADTAHRAKIAAEIVEALKSMMPQSALIELADGKNLHVIAEAMIAGQIPHVTVNL